MIAAHVGRLRRADLARVVRPVGVDPSLDGDAKRQVRRDRLNALKKGLTGSSSARWANAVIAANDDQYRLARDAQYRHIVGLRAAIATIEQRLGAPTVDLLTVTERKARRKANAPKGYASQAERFAKQRRVQHLRAVLAGALKDRAANRVHVVEGGARLAKTRHHLDAAGLTANQWRDCWDAARYRITANGSPDEPFGNLTITVTAAGVVSVRLPKPLEYLANAKRGRYILSGVAAFTHRGDEWAARICTGNSVSYTITRRPGRAGRYLTAAWRYRPCRTGLAPATTPPRKGICSRRARWSGLISTTGIWRCAAWMPTATRSGVRTVSTSTSEAAQHAGMPRSATRSPA